MPASLYALAFLACPIGMGLMMWMMMRGNQHQPNDDTAARQAKLVGMQAEIDQLRAAVRDREHGGQSLTM